MSELKIFPANLELRESTLDGQEVAGLSHQQGGMFLLFVQEVAADGEPVGALTIVHDAGDHGGRYLELAESLARAGWAVSLPDMRGHGRSEGDRGHSGGLVEAVRDLGEIQDHLSYMAPSVPRVLVGVGLGALQALAFAVEQPGASRGLVLVNPLLAPAFELPQPAKGLKKFLNRVGPTTPGTTGFTAERLSGDAAQAQAWSADELTHDKITLHAGEEARQAIERYGPQLEKSGVATLVLQGEADPFGDLERVRGLSGEGVEVRTFAGARHDLFHDAARAEATAALTDWLGRLPKD